MIDLDTLVIGPTVQAFGTAVSYQPLIPTLTPLGAPIYDDNGDPVGTFGTAYAAVGVFDEQFIEVTPEGKGPFSSTEALDLGAPGGITGAMPVLGVQLSAMQTAPAQGDKVTINGTAYLVREVQPDGHGHAKLLLNLSP